jgi:uncharacterized membrane protein
MFAGLFLTPLQEGRWKAWMSLVVFALATALLARFGGGLYPLFVPPLAIPALVLSAFASSLLPGQKPMVTRIAESTHGALPDYLIRYTRSVTWVWTVFMTGLLLAIVYLMVFGPLEAWSALANFGGYLMIGALFIGEYIYRRLRFPDFNHLSFIASMRQAVTTRIR